MRNIKKKLRKDVGKKIKKIENIGSGEWDKKDDEKEKDDDGWKKRKKRIKKKIGE